MRNTALTATPVPGLDDPPNVPLHLGNVADLLETFAIPRFATAAARTTAWPSPPKGALSVRLDGTVPVAGSPVYEEFNGTVWRPLPGTVIYSYTQVVPDPGGGTSVGGLRDIVFMDAPSLYPYPVLHVCNVQAYFGFSTGASWGYADLFYSAGNVAVATAPQSVWTQANLWAALPLVGQAVIPANTSAQMKYRFNLVNGGAGTVHTGGIAMNQIIVQ